MKKIIIYIGIAVLAGILAGYFMFHESSNVQLGDTHDHELEMGKNQIWTCSMHPQIRQTAPGSCPICGMDLILADTDSNELSDTQFTLSKNAMALADIQTTVLGQGTLGGQSLKLSGLIQENEEQNATQAAYFDGRIEKLYVNYEGQQVRQGQPLASIYSPQLVSAQQELLTAMSLKESQPSLYLAVKNKLKLWKLTDKQISAIESSGRVQESFPIYSSISGIVSKIMVDEGDYIKQGAPLLKIVNLTTVWAVFDGYENQVSQLKKGQEIQVKALAYPNNSMAAKITFIDPVLSATKRTVKIRAEIENKKNLLKPGMFVEGMVAVETQDQEGLIIPQSAVLWTGKRSLVYLKTDVENPVFEIREITLGDAVEEGYIVLDGLATGDEIVTHGTFTVDAAAQLKGKKSMMNEGGNMNMGHQGHKGMGSTTESGNQEESPAFQKTLKPVLDSYMGLKDALVQSDPTKVQQASEQAISQLKRVNTSALKGAVIDQVKAMEKSFMAISENTSIEKQRQHFVILSNHFVAILPNLIDPDKRIYVQHCPMANSNKGADWLSWEQEIRNPYYGEAMLRCGEITMTL
jgi:Cu(I)/Ag(I) efflux system membrane fusion protein